MSVAHRILAVLGLQLAEPSKERELLGRLAFCTTDDEQYLATLNQAVLIAQAGGTTDEKLEALLHLGAVGMMLPATEQALHRAGIDTRPWPVVRREWKAAGAPLHQFLMARFDEDDAAVRANWNADGVTDTRWWGTPFQPSRVLRETAAKRAIVQRLAPLDDIQVRRQTRTLASAALRLLAQPYVDHPDFDPEWQTDYPSRP